MTRARLLSGLVTVVLLALVALDPFSDRFGLTAGVAIVVLAVCAAIFFGGVLAICAGDEPEVARLIDGRLR